MTLFKSSQDLKSFIFFKYKLSGWPYIKTQRMMPKIAYLQPQEYCHLNSHLFVL